MNHAERQPSTPHISASIYALAVMWIFISSCSTPPLRASQAADVVEPSSPVLSVSYIDARNAEVRFGNKTRSFSCDDEEALIELVPHESLPIIAVGCGSLENRLVDVTTGASLDVRSWLPSPDGGHYVAVTRDPFSGIDLVKASELSRYIAASAKSNRRILYPELPRSEIDPAPIVAVEKWKDTRVLRLTSGCCDSAVVFDYCITADLLLQVERIPDASDIGMARWRTGKDAASPCDKPNTQ